MLKLKLNLKLTTFLRLLLVEAFLLALYPQVTEAAPASIKVTTNTLASTAAAPVAAPVTIHLKVVSARTEPNWPGTQPGGITKGAAVPEYQFIINEDNAGDPTQARENGCAPGFSANGKSYPDTCNWPSIHAAPGAAPIVTQGDQTLLNGTTGITLDPGNYLISVTADNYKIDGVHFSTFSDPGPLTVALQPYPLPLATVKIQVFNDTNTVNGQYDVPGELGIPGFQGHLFDVLGEVTDDWFGNPLCTQYVTDNTGKITLDAVGKPTPIAGTGGRCLSGNDGVITIPNVGPNRYTAQVIPPAGTTWVQTTTLEGWHDFDVWVQEGATGFDTEFTGPNAEPVPAIPFGFVQPTNIMTGGTGAIKGVVDSSKTYIPQAGGVPLNNQDFTIGAGTKVDKPINKPWIALNDLQRGDQSVYVGQGNADGTFNIPNVPAGDYQAAIWDGPQNEILELRNVTVVGGQTTDMGTILLAGWWTTLDGYVFIDSNSNGKRDPGEQGLPNQVVTLKTRGNSVMDRGSTTAVTDKNGYYLFPNGYPLTAWVVMEVYNDRFFTTGVTYQADNQPQETTLLGAGVDVSVHPVIGLSGRMDWGVKPYAPGTNGGIVGTVTYDTTRNELDPRYAATETYQPGIPGLDVKLYATVKDSDGNFVMEADGSYKKGPLLNTYTTETWERPKNCAALDLNGNPVVQSVLPPSTGDYDCLEVPMMGVQYQNGFSTVDGNYGFGTILADPVTGQPIPETALPAGDYLVQVEIPNDAFGRPLYKVTKEEDVNVFNGDQFTPQIPPTLCAGPLHTVNVTNPYFLDAGGSPYEGQSRPLCDTRLVTVQNSRSIAPNFNLFTDVPLPGRFTGLIVDDLNVSSNPQETLFGEKRGVPNAPIGIYDFSGRLVDTIQSDPNGLFEVLMPSTSSYNCPLPAGPCPNVYRFVGNDPGAPGHLNANYNPHYRTIGTEFEMWPGLLIPADLAPTATNTAIAIPGSQANTFPQCRLDGATPQVFAVNKPYFRQTDSGAARQLIISGQGFGTTPGKVVLGSQTIQSGFTGSTWTDSQITLAVPAASGSFNGPQQLTVIGSNNQSSVNGLTVHILNGTYNPTLYEAGPGKTYGTIQAAVTAASTGNNINNRKALVVVYPGTVTPVNPKGVYYENIVISRPIKLQGVGPGGVRSNNTYVPGSILDGLGYEQINAGPWTTLVTGLNRAGNQQIYDGAVVTVYAPATPSSAFTDARNRNFNAAIDGLTIQGGDQLGNPNKVNSLPNGGVALTQGGGIFVNGYAGYLQITNNVIQSNGGSYGGAIRVGTAYVGDNHNYNLHIASNRILANGGTNLGGSIALFTGSNGYEVDHNDICGNYSAEYGGGISHYGLSPNGKIHNNRIYFNSSYDEGAGVFIAGELPANPNNLSAGAGTVDIYANQIQDNLANDDGGGIRFLMAGTAQMHVYNNFIVNNVSTHEGGGLALDDAPNVQIVNNTIMKNITTATAATSNGQPAPAGLSTAANSVLLQAALPAGSPLFSKPLLFNNIFWDNRAGTWNGLTLNGAGLPGDPNPVNYWDMGVADNTGLLAPTYSDIQSAVGFTPSPTNLSVDPQIKDATYNSAVAVFPWRGDPSFLGSTLVAVDLPPNLLGNYHLQAPVNNTGGSPAIDKGIDKVGTVLAPLSDIDGDTRPGGTLFDIGGDEIPGALLPPPPPPPAPTLAVLDNFNRANTGSPLYGLGNNWRGDTIQYQVDTNVARLRNSGLLPNGGMVFWNPTSFGANQAASFKLTATNTTGAAQALMLKLGGLVANGLGWSSHAIKVNYLVSGSNRQVIVQTLTACPQLVSICSLTPVSQRWVTQATYTVAAPASATPVLEASAQANGTVSVWLDNVFVGSVNVTTTPQAWSTSYANAGGNIGISSVPPSGNFNTTTMLPPKLDDFSGGTLP
ncbi:MAG: hypothetical protein J0I20_35180 [Chloroflexi bacterium]|nr:hypothetical protein [Chloroflexota bacterium]OJV88907.1 MAG: hypothetical protein BGO39_02710 [Chloroflexi bacterium 54-19]